jgi:hypothetical protein
MARDSLFGETIEWSGKPKVLTVPPAFKAAAAACAVVAVTTLCFAIVVATALHVSVGGMLVFSAWCGTLALLSWRLPLVWRARLEYIVTDKHVIWRRGPVRRTIERSAISYALVRWSSRASGVGDLVLVRAVPTGALRRTLTLTLADVEAPDRLWALIRGEAASAPLGDGERPIAQRLDDGERVLWSGIPLASPWGTRRVLTALTGVILAAALARMLVRAIPSLKRVLGLHALPAASAAVLVAGVALAALLLCAAAAWVAYAAWVRPVLLAKRTRYYVTNKRVLIRRDLEELSLDRSRIAYVIAAPARGLQHVFLVLDGPQARALAPSGAFGGDDRGELLPVFASIENADAETVGALLRPSGRFAALRDAA